MSKTNRERPMTSQALAIVLAAEKFADALPYPVVSVEMALCARCGGKGHAHFIGDDRAPGVCFRCAGSGKIARTRAGARALKAAAAAREVERLRVLYRGLTLAMSFATAGVATCERAADLVLKDLSSQRVSVVAWGKAAAQGITAEAA